MKRILFYLSLLIAVTVNAQEDVTISKAMDNYDYETAIQLIDNVSKPDANLLFLKARAYKGLVRYNEAIACLQDVLKEDTLNLQAMMDLSEMYRLSGKFYQSLKQYEEVLAHYPDNKYIKLQYLNLLYRLEKHQEVIELCDEVMQTDSSNYVLRLAAQSYDALLNDRQAMSFYAKALEKNPLDYISASRLATLYIDIEPQTAIDITEEYRKLDGNNLFVNRINAQAYCIKTDYETAYKRYKPLIEQGDISRTTCYYYGVTCFTLKKYKDAYTYLKIALIHNPTDVNVAYYLGRAACRAKQVKEGVQYLELALNLSIPKDENMGRLYGGLAEGYGMALDRQNQVNALKEQLKYTPENSLILYRLGTVYQDFLKDEKNAERYLELFIKTKPDDMDTSKPRPVASGAREPIDYYIHAELRLREIREEKFFRGEVKEEEFE